MYDNDRSSGTDEDTGETYHDKSNVKYGSLMVGPTYQVNDSFFICTGRAKSLKQEINRKTVPRMVVHTRIQRQSMKKRWHGGWRTNESHKEFCY